MTRHRNRREIRAIHAKKGHKGPARRLAPLAKANLRAVSLDDLDELVASDRIPEEFEDEARKALNREDGAAAQEILDELEAAGFLADDPEWDPDEDDEPDEFEIGDRRLTAQIAATEAVEKYLEDKDIPFHDLSELEVRKIVVRELNAAGVPESYQTQSVIEDLTSGVMDDVGNSGAP